MLAKKASAIARREQLASWLHGVARQTALDARARTARQKAREKRLGAMRPVEAPDQSTTGELRVVLDEELAHLPERHRDAILLCELEGMSRRDAAVRLGISEGTLSSRLARAKSRLRDPLTRRGFALSSWALTTILTQDAHAVILPPLLLDSTIRVATLVAVGSSLTGVVSTSVATLSEGVIKAMLLAKLKCAFLGLVTLAVVSTSVGALAQYGGPQTGPGRPSDNDRLRSVEQKLDKLLDVLGRSGRPSAMPADAPPVPAPPGLPGLPGATDLDPVLPTPVTGTSGIMAMMGTVGPAIADRPTPVPRLGVSSGIADQPDLASRVDHLERRLGDLERRLDGLERRLDGLERRLTSHPLGSGVAP